MSWATYNSISHGSQKVEAIFPGTHNYSIDQAASQTNILMKPNIFGRIVRWSIKLSEFDLKYIPRTVIKTQALTNFIVKQVDDKQNKEQKV